MTYVESLLSTREANGHIRRMKSIGVKLVKRRAAKSGEYLTFAIPDEIGFGGPGTKRKTPRVSRAPGVLRCAKSN